MEIKKFEPKTIKTPTKETPKKVSPVVEKEKLLKDITKFEKFEVINEHYYEELTLEQKVENLQHRLRNIESRIG